MSRKDEFIELKQELEQTPVELEYTAAKAVTRAKKQRRRSFIWKAPAVSFCSIIIMFVLLVNLFPKVALAMSNVPILKNLVQAVAFDPSLKAAVENDYYQYVGESQTQEDVTVNVEYMIVDAGHISLFFSVDAPVDAGLYHFNLLKPDGNPLPVPNSYDTMYKVGKLEEIQMFFLDDAIEIPEEFIFKVTVNKDPLFQEVMDMVAPEEGEQDIQNSIQKNEASGIDYEFSFTLYPDDKYSKTVVSIPIGQWVDMKGQRIYLDKLDIYPTKARLYLNCDNDNSAILEKLSIYFEDNKGSIYDTPDNGLVSSGTDDSFSINSLYFESSYFAGADNLTMYIDGITMIDKDKLYGEINYSERTITNLPEGVIVDTMELSGSTLDLVLKKHFNKPNYYFDLISSEYYDLEGNHYYFGTWTRSFYGDDEYTLYANYKIENYEDNKYKLRWINSQEQVLEKAIVISIK